ncbi:hypothetical protein [Methylohalobius crimeensis]|uniref:hypothetical protein n=1 Tax=Methylohalobius crimeensis TaxID=244365 RepID=UPI0003B315D0|nr:hypothetical protein [Methylohalobius crimeensis]
MKQYRLKQLVWGVLTSLGCLTFHPLVEADSGYVPYPGKVEVRVQQVPSPKAVIVGFETWPGFSRNFRVTLPDIEVPKDAPGAAECERRLARKARAFVQNFLTEESRSVYIVDMRMADSATGNGVASIVTDRGELKRILLDKGWARPSSQPTNEPWCE